MVHLHEIRFRLEENIKEDILLRVSVLGHKPCHLLTESGTNYIADFLNGQRQIRL
jgi:hypothetical protein